ncbi:MAG: epoxyalkane--coenzyme M transferase, partial [Chloroflexota bacterium]|nr:epoxyalkane--coenzyme M transferase [Chloroflexota bacterium]
MRRSTERILTTHTGSLPRPPDLTRSMYDYIDGKPIDQNHLRERFRSATADIVRQQIAAGVDAINDGEFTKAGYSTYVTDRLTGFEGPPAQLVISEMQRYPEYWGRMFQDRAMEGFPHLKTPTCNGPIGIKDSQAVQRDINNFKAALQGTSPTDTFMTAASPGVIAAFLENHHYPTEEAYLAALADAMRPEYEAISNAGFTLQLDCPDLAMSRQMGAFATASLEDFRRSAALRVEALNHAVARIPAEQMRMHICWGNWEGPHDGDVPLRDVIDVILRAKPSAISLEAANPRHAHEWQVFEEIKLPEG